MRMRGCISMGLLDTTLQEIDARMWCAREDNVGGGLSLMFVWLILSDFVPFSFLNLVFAYWVTCRWSSARSETFVQPSNKLAGDQHMVPSLILLFMLSFVEIGWLSLMYLHMVYYSFETFFYRKIKVVWWSLEGEHSILTIYHYVLRS